MSTPEHIETLAKKVIATANELKALGRKIPFDAIYYEWDEINIRWHAECQELFFALRDAPNALGRVSVVVGDNVVTCETRLEPGDLGRPAWERISFSKLVAFVSASPQLTPEADLLEFAKLEEDIGVSLSAGDPKRAIADSFKRAEDAHDDMRI